MRTILARLGRRAGVFAYRVMKRRLEPIAKPPPAGIGLRLMTSEELLPMCADPAVELTPQKAGEAFARGELCAAALDGERLAGYAWFAFEPAPHVDGIWMAFHRGASYTYRAFVHPAYRGHGIAPALYRLADPACIERGRTLTLLCIELHNRASLSAAARSGATDAGYVAYWNTHSRLFAVRSPGARRCGFRFFRT